MKKKNLKYSLTVLSIAFFCIATAFSNYQPNVDIYTKGYVKDIMLKVYLWQSTHPVDKNKKDDWARAVFYSGAMQAYLSNKDQQYLQGAQHYADSLHFRPGKRLRHADDMACGQTFLQLYKVKKESYMLNGIKARMDSLISDPKPGREDWWWCDALFMEPPVLAMLSEQTGDPKYDAYMNKMWWDTADFLFDKDEDLFYRDKSYFNKRSVNGKKVFWSRGNGWVMGGLVQVMEHLPKTDSYYKRYEDLYIKMAKKISSLQQPDGLWRASLLDPADVPVKETSGSGFYTFAIAWGINKGYLSRSEYLPVVVKGWKALNEAVDPDGKLTWVQQIGASPDKVQESDNQEYGSGAFLMAGTQVMLLHIKP